MSTEYNSNRDIIDQQLIHSFVKNRLLDEDTKQSESDRDDQNRRYCISERETI